MELVDFTIFALLLILVVVSVKAWFFYAKWLSVKKDISQLESFSLGEIALLERRIESQEGREAYKVLQSFYHAIEEDTELPAFYKVIMGDFFEIQNHHECLLYLVDEGQEALFLAYPGLAGSETQAFSPLVSIRNDSSADALPLSRLLRSCYRERKASVSDLSDSQGSEANASLKSVMLIPLVDRQIQLGVLVVKCLHEKHVFTESWQLTLEREAQKISFALGLLQINLKIKEKKALKKQLVNAQEVQRYVFPKGALSLPGFEIYGYNRPAQIVSGDYYDYQTITEEVEQIVIGDVSGKGAPAGLVVAAFRSYMRSANNMISPSEKLSKVNEQLFPDLQDEMFVSSICLFLNHKTSNLTLARAGHTPPYYFNAKLNAWSKLKLPGMAVGIDSGSVFSKVIKDYQLQMEEGDVLCLYTDGVTEAQNKDLQEYASSRFEAKLVEHQHLAPEHLTQSILEDIEQFTAAAPLSDDLTLVFIKKTNP